MNEIVNPQVTLAVTWRAEQNHIPVLNEYQGPMEAPMSQEQQDCFKALIGDGQFRVTLSRELGESDYGTGGKVFLSLSGVCDQSQPYIEAMVEGLRGHGEFLVEQHWASFRERLVAMGLMKAVR